MEGRKDDLGKLRFDLISPDALEGLAEILIFGATKYSPRNWEKGINFSRLYASTLRHLHSFWQGSDIDYESRKQAIDHAQCCIHFLSHYIHNYELYKEFDDRNTIEMWGIYPHDNNYEVSSLGNIKRVGGKGKLLSKTDCGCGYLRVGLSKKNIASVVYIHRMVLETFTGKRPDGMECNHKNGIKYDNRLKNLEWVTAKQNKKHAIKLGLYAYGEKQGRAKLKNKQIVEIRKLFKQGFSPKQLSIKFNVTRRNIQLIIDKKTWKHI